MHYELQENIRLDKVCKTCYYGTHLTGDENFNLCFKYKGEEPISGPRIKTCFDWIKSINKYDEKLDDKRVEWSLEIEKRSLSESILR